MKTHVPCNNVKCPHYKQAEKRDWSERLIGVSAKQGFCKYGYCKLKKGRFF